MLFENNDYMDMIFNMPNLNDFNNSSNLSVSEGFLRGNMFENEYVPYKNMTYIKPSVKGEREKDLLKIMEYSFAINDYNLYLDLHPEDMEILSKYKAASQNLEKCMNEYEKKYGPLNITTSDYNTFKWIDAPWPWQKEDGKYV